jgi:hypothetical protein
MTEKRGQEVTEKAIVQHPNTEEERVQQGTPTSRRTAEKVR